MLFVWILGVIALLALVYQLYNRNKIFERLGISGPKPAFLFGNMADVFGQHNVQSLQLQKWTKQYGPVYGFMDGGRPMLVFSDPDMLQDVLVKKFDHFHARKEFPIQVDPDSNDERVDMFMARGPRWKRLRVISNPTFTSAKIKQMMPKVHSCVKEMLEILEEKRLSGESFDIYRVYQAFTMDVIGRVAFAVETSVQRDENNELLRLGNGIFRRQREAMLFLPTIFPKLRRLVFLYAMLTARLRGLEWMFLHDRMTKLVEEKRKTKVTAGMGSQNISSKESMVPVFLEWSRHLWSNIFQITGGTDLIELLLNAEADPNDSIVDSVNVGNEAAMKGLSIQKKLTAAEIASQCFLFMVAGYETTSTALTYVTYLLVNHPEVQEQLLDEIDEHFADGQEITYESVHKLQFLDCVIDESLRLYPFGSPVVARTCMKTCTINGVHIPKGMTVLADVWSLHRSEELWGSDAEEFKPERFLPGSGRKPTHPLAFLPFGAGPRTCIGMRFALLELKDPLQLRYTEITVAPKHGLRVGLEKRE